MGKAYETAIQKYAEVDLIELTADRIQGETGVEIPQMPYAGWVFFRGYKGNRLADTIRMAYTHGSGGGGPVTKGTIQASRRANYLPDANIVVGGHIHESWTMEFNRERITTRGELFKTRNGIYASPPIKTNTVSPKWLVARDRQRSAPERCVLARLIYVSRSQQ